MQRLITISILVAAFALAGQTRAADSTKVTLHPQTGRIVLGDNLATVVLDSSYCYIDPKQAEYVIVNLWGNPPGFSCLGMVFPRNLPPTRPDAWAAVLSYTEDGYVKDKDADKINYDKLLTQMRKQTLDGNKERKKEGYPGIELLGWAEKPYYDKDTKKLFWAKLLKFEGDTSGGTLNYDVRILGRKGYLVMTVVAGASQLEQVKPSMQHLLGTMEFNSGNRYGDYKPGVDKVATYGIAALVAGGILAKVGFFKALIVAVLALKKLIIAGAIAAGAGISAFFKKRRQTKEMVRKLPS